MNAYLVTLRRYGSHAKHITTLVVFAETEEAAYLCRSVLDTNATIEGISRAPWLDRPAEGSFAQSLMHARHIGT